MRALKTFMRDRKKDMLGCGECKCRTLQCWRYADEYCDCGDNVTPPVPPVPPTPTTYTVSFVSNPAAGGSVTPSSLEVEEGATVLTQDNFITIGGTTAEAQPADSYVFGGWEILPETITENTSITADFTYVTSLIDITAPSVNSIQVAEGATNNEVTFSYDPVDAMDVDFVVAISSTDDTIATAQISNFENGTATITITGVAEGTCTITYSFAGDNYDIEVEVTPGL